MQNEINRNLKNFSTQLIVEEAVKPFPTETDDDLTEAPISVYGTEFEHELMERIIEPDTKGLKKDNLWLKLVDICNLDPEKRLDEVLALIPEDEEVEVTLKKVEEKETKEV